MSWKKREDLGGEEARRKVGPALLVQPRRRRRVASSFFSCFPFLGTDKSRKSWRSLNVGLIKRARELVWPAIGGLLDTMFGMMSGY